jgi:hypothetical protein
MGKILRNFSVRHALHCSEEVLSGIKSPDWRDEGRLNATFTV